MIPSHDYNRLLPYDQCAYEMMLQERQKELKRVIAVLSGEETAIEMELLVLTWRKTAGKPMVKKVVLYEDFFKRVRRAPRQDKVGNGLSPEEAQVLSGLKF
jgi:hypothetical protein